LQHRFAIGGSFDPPALAIGLHRRQHLGPQQPWLETIAFMDAIDANLQAALR